MKNVENLKRAEMEVKQYSSSIEFRRNVGNEVQTTVTSKDGKEAVVYFLDTDSAIEKFREWIIYTSNGGLVINAL